MKWQHFYLLPLLILGLGRVQPVQGLEIQWYGQAAFLFKSDNGIKLITDPYQPDGFGEKFRYSAIKDSADIVTVSHEHADHNGVSSISGNPFILRSLGTQTVKNIPITGIASNHDKAGGTLRGKNTIYCFTIDKLRICHLGDLGEIPNAKKIREIQKEGPFDILLAPVGAVYTLEPDEMKSVIQQLNPRVVIPMHYKTTKMDLPLLPVEKFLAGQKNVTRLKASTWSITRKTLPAEKGIMVLDPSN